MAGQKKYSQRAIREAIKDSGGIKKVVIERLECSRQTLDNYLAESPELAALLAEERENIVDLAESKLVKALKADDMRAILFTLETQGKARGWTKRQEITGADGMPFGLSPDVLELMRQMGVEPSEVVKQFEQMVREQAGVNRGG